MNECAAEFEDAVNEMVERRSRVPSPVRGRGSSAVSRITMGRPRLTPRTQVPIIEDSSIEISSISITPPANSTMALNPSTDTPGTSTMALNTPIEPKIHNSRFGRFFITISSSPFILHNIGFIHMTIASLLFALMGFAVQKVYETTEDLSAFIVVFVRSIIALFLCIADGWWNDVIPVYGIREVRWLLILRGIFGFTSISAGYFSLKFLSLGDSTALSFTAPVFTAIAARLILKERWGYLDALAGLVSLVGVFFIARPPFIFKYFDSSISGNYSDTNIVGVILSIASALLTAAGFVVIRRISRRAEPTQIVMMLSIVSCIVALPCHAILPGSKWIVPDKWETYIWLVVVSVSSFAGQIFMCKSLAVESAARASSFQYIQVIFAYLFDLAVNKNIQVTSIVGACIIGFSVLCIAFSKIQQAKRRLSANLMKAGPKLAPLIINKR